MSVKYKHVARVVTAVVECRNKRTNAMEIKKVVRSIIQQHEMRHVYPWI